MKISGIDSLTLYLLLLFFKWILNCITLHIRFTIWTIFSCVVLAHLRTFSLLCKHHHHPSPEHFSSCQTETLYLLNNSPFCLLLRVPWTARRSNQSILKEINTGISLEGMMLKLKLRTLVTSCEALTLWKRL